MMDIFAFPLLIAMYAILIVINILTLALPTVTIFVISWLFSKVFLKIINSSIPLQVLVTIFISIILGLNVRIPILFEYLLFDNNEVNIFSKQDSGYPKIVRLESTIDSFSFKDSPCETISLTSTPGGGLFVFNNPFFREIDIKRTLYNEGFSISTSGTSDYEIKVKENETKFFNIIEVTITKGKEIISNGKRKYIKYMPLEKYHTDSVKKKIFTYLASQNIWNYLLGEFTVFGRQYDLISELTKKTFGGRIVPNKIEPVRLSAKEIDNFEEVVEHSVARGKSGDFIHCNEDSGISRIAGLNLEYLGVNTPIKSNISVHNYEKILCGNDEIKIIETSSQHIKYESYSLNGELKNYFTIPLPKKLTYGYPRKPLIYLDCKQDGIIFGLEEFSGNKEYGQKVESIRHFYFAPIKYSNIDIIKLLTSCPTGPANSAGL